nr:retrovirus-related Pol polyprotein from transposon TNT 1-94 [Tanacetum cinerariifolium]
RCLPIKKDITKGLEGLDQPRNLLKKLKKPVLLVDEESVSSKDERVTKVKAFISIIEEEPSVGKNDARSGGRGRKKDSISSKEVLFSKTTESSSKAILKITSDSKSECGNLEPLPPLPKLTKAEPIGTSANVLTLVNVSLTLTVFEDIRKVPEKRSAIKAPKEKAQTMSPSAFDPIPVKKADSSTKKLLLNLMEEVKGLKKELKTHGTIFNQNNEVVLIAPRRMDVYVINISSYNEERNACFFATTSNSVNWLWHKRLSNLNFKNINKLARQNLVAGLSSHTFSKDKTCSACEKGKHHKTSFKTKRSFSISKARSPDISYFHVFGCPVHIHNHIDHLGKFDAKADDGFFLGYSPINKASRGDEINFNENRSFPDDELLVPRTKVSQCFGNDAYFPYVLAHDPLSTNNIYILDNVTPLETPILQDSNLFYEHPEITIVYDHHVLNKHDNSKLVEDLRITDDQVSSFIKPISNVEPSPTIISPSAKVFINPPVLQDRWSIEKHIELVNILGEPQVKVTTRSRIIDSKTASVHECLYVNFLSKSKPKKLIEALKEEGWMIAMQEELNQFERNKVPIFCDNTSATAISNNPVFHCRTKHIDISCISTTLTKQPSAYYSKYLREFWYTAEVESAMNTITFTLSSLDKLYPSTLMSFHLRKRYLSLIIEHLLGDAYINENLKTIKPHHITASTFKPSITSEVSLTSYMRKVTKLSEQPEKPLILPSKEVNTDTTTDKSLFETCVQLGAQSKARIDKKSKKKRNFPSSKSKTSKIIKDSSPSTQVADTQNAEEPVTTTDATKVLDASKSKEEQGNQPKTVDAEKVPTLNIKDTTRNHSHNSQGKSEKEVDDEFIDSRISSLGNVTFEELHGNSEESPYDTESEIKVVKRFNLQHFDDDDQIKFMGPVYSDMEDDTEAHSDGIEITLTDSSKDARVVEADFALESMPGDETELVSGFETTETEDDDTHS